MVKLYYALVFDFFFSGRRGSLLLFTLSNAAEVTVSEEMMRDQEQIYFFRLRNLDNLNFGLGNY